MGPPYPAPPLRHFPSVQTAFGDLENDLRSGAGTEAPRALTAETRLPFTTSPMTDGDLGDGETRVRQVKAKQLSTGGGGRKGPLHESAGLVWQAWRPGDRLGTNTKAKAKSPGRTPCQSQNAGRSQASDPDWSKTASNTTASAGPASTAARVSTSERRKYRRKAPDLQDLARRMSPTDEPELSMSEAAPRRKACQPAVSPSSVQ